VEGSQTDGEEEGRIILKSNLCDKAEAWGHFVTVHFSVADKTALLLIDKNKTCRRKSTAF